MGFSIKFEDIIRLIICGVANPGNPAPFSGAGAPGCKGTHSTEQIIIGEAQSWLDKFRSNFETRFRIYYKASEVLPDFREKSSKKVLRIFPNFVDQITENSLTLGTVMIKPDYWEKMDIKVAELHGLTSQPDSRIKVINEHLQKNGFIGGYPTFEQSGQGENLVYGAIGLKAAQGHIQKIHDPLGITTFLLKEMELPAPTPAETLIISQEPTPSRNVFRAYHNYAISKGFVAGLPIFTGSTGIFFKKEAARLVNLPWKTFAVLSAFSTSKEKKVKDLKKEITAPGTIIIEISDNNDLSADGSIKVRTPLRDLTVQPAGKILVNTPSDTEGGGSGFSLTSLDTIVNLTLPK